MNNAPSPLSDKAKLDLSLGVQTFLVGVFAATFLAVPYFMHLLNGDPYLFFQDDIQTEYMPLFHEIARLLKAGQFPLITDRVWNGGALINEYQLGILNPICLLLIWIISYIPDLGQAVAVYVIFHYALYAAGIYYLCRQLNYKTVPALVSVSVGGSSLWLLYWGATTWLPALVSMAWFPWSFAALVVVYRHPRYFLLGSIMVAMPILAGWPVSVFSMLVIFSCIAAVVLCRCYKIMTSISLNSFNEAGFFYKACHVFKLFFCNQVIPSQTESMVNTRRLFLVGVCAACGLMMAMPALLPSFLYISKESTRVLGPDITWSTRLDNLLTINLPYFSALWNVYGHYQWVFVNYTYASWFFPVLLFSLPSKEFSRPTMLWFLFLVVLFAALSMAPQFWEFRWNFRFLPYWHLIVGLMCGWILSQEDIVSKWTFRGLLLGFGVPFFLSYCSSPGHWHGPSYFLPFLLLLTIMVLVLQYENHKEHFILLFGQIFFLFCIFTLSHNDNIPTWPVPTQIVAPVDESQNEIFLYSHDPLSSHFSKDVAGDDFFWDHIMYGNSGLYYGRTTINGYSPIYAKGFSRNFCFGHIGQSCKKLPDWLMTIDEVTHQPFIDLLKVERVTALKEFAEPFQKAAGPIWKQDNPLSSTYPSFVRASPLPPYPGSISWMQYPATLTLVSRTAQREEYSVDAVVQDNKILFARAWYMGMSAELNGQKLSLVPYRDLLPLVTLPAGSQGRLVLSYWPTGMTLGLILALCGGLLSLTAGAYFGGRKFSEHNPEAH